MIYLIKASNQVKIGFSREPDARLKQLQTGNHAKLNLLFCIPNTSFKDEKLLHELYSVYRIRDNSEWFKINGLLIDFIEEGRIAKKRNKPLNLQTLASQSIKRLKKRINKLKYKTSQEKEHFNAEEKHLWQLAKLMDKGLLDLPLFSN